MNHTEPASERERSRSLTGVGGCLLSAWMCGMCRSQQHGQHGGNAAGGGNGAVAGPATNGGGGGRESANSERAQNSGVLKLRGLPFSSNKQNIQDFFEGV